MVKKKRIRPIIKAKIKKVEPKEEKFIAPITGPTKVIDKTTESGPSIHAPLHTKSGIERINAIPDYTKIMEPNMIERTIMKFYPMTKTQLIHASKDPYNTMMEISILGMIKIMHDPSDSKYVSVNKYIHDRIGGRPKERIEHSGPGGSAIQTEDIGFKLDLNNMTGDQLRALKKAREIEQEVIASVSNNKDVN